MNQLRPIAGATKGSSRPKTVLISDGATLTVTDNASGHSICLTPAALYCYEYVQQSTKKSGHDPKLPSVKGMAALDVDGLVLLDLPGEWYKTDVERFSAKSGIPLVDARSQPPHQVRTTLASRAPGWQRLRGLPDRTLRKWQKPAAIGAGAVGLIAMAYLASVGLWGAWRGLSAVGSMLLDLLNVKWLAIAFSPALLFIRPVLARIHRWRTKRGFVLGLPLGLNLRTEPYDKIRIIHGSHVITELRTGESPGQAFSLLLYRHEDLTGLFILDRPGRALHHLPGPWPPEAANTFAKRNKLILAVHRLTRDEYLALTKNTKEATP
ncbi:hypothetical protein ABZ897_31090 [Nonomuraea sp. NPDC046802]|uniref:hypothetical protein n=1 Tax=Nonomuraea sp. NPDC046802 TaxID=3154919 RepID=UPI00340D3EBA